MYFNRLSDDQTATDNNRLGNHTPQKSTLNQPLNQPLMSQNRLLFQKNKKKYDTQRLSGFAREFYMN